MNVLNDHGLERLQYESKFRELLKFTANITTRTDYNTEMSQRGSV